MHLIFIIRYNVSFINYFKELISQIYFMYKIPYC